jgi:hypothetical protein
VIRKARPAACISSEAAYSPRAQAALQFVQLREAVQADGALRQKFLQAPVKRRAWAAQPGKILRDGIRPQARKARRAIWRGSGG